MILELVSWVLYKVSLLEEYAMALRSKIFLKLYTLSSVTTS